MAPKRLSSSGFTPSTPAQLGVSPGEILFVGDNPTVDILGA